MKDYYSIHGQKLSIEGYGPLYDYLSFQFKYFENINFKEKTYNTLFLKVQDKIEITPDKTLSNKNTEYIRDGRYFIYRSSGRLARLDGGSKIKEQQLISFENSFPKMRTNTLIDMILRFNFLLQDIVLIHASCVTNKNKTILIPAWKKSGKTSVALKLVEAGYNFLSDDKIWVSSTGTVYSYPRYVVIKDTNAFHFKNFLAHKTGIKLYFKKRIHKNKYLSNNMFIRFLEKRYLTIPVRYHYIEELYPKTDVPIGASLSHILYLNKNEKIDRVSIEKYYKNKMASNILNISNIEWNYDLLVLASAHDTLFPEGPSWTEELNRLIQNEKNIINDTVLKAECFEAAIPSNEEKTDWDNFISEVSRI